jgi:hypothetical protein
MEKDRDPQKERLYEWEASFARWNKNVLTLKECKALIYDACDAHGVPRPTVKQHHQRSLSWNLPESNLIDMQGGGHQKPGGRNEATALHEAAHQVCWCLYRNRIADHGPRYLGIYLDLLVRAGVSTRKALEATARAYKLKWAYDDRHRIT